MFRNFMNAFWQVRFISAFVLATMALTGVAALADEQPDADAKLKVGDTVIVTADGTEIGLGAKTLHLLKKGTKAEIIQIRDSWIGVELQLEEKTVKGWIQRGRLSAVEPETKAKPEAPSSLPVAAKDPSASVPSDVDINKKDDTKAPADASKATLADEFAKMIEKIDQTEGQAKPAPTATDKPETAKAPPSDDVAPKDPPAAQDASTGVQPALKTDATPGTELANPPVEEPAVQPPVVTSDPAPVSVEPDQPETEATDAALQAKEGETKPKETQPSDPAVPPVAEKKDDVPASSPPKPSDLKPGVEATKPTEAQPAETEPTETEPSKKPDEPPKTATPAGEKPADLPPGGEQATGEQIGEGPEALAEKFAEILARLKAQENKAGGATQQPTIVPEKPPVTAPQKIEPVVDTELDQPVTINVLVLRKADDLQEVDASERIGQLILSGGQFDDRTLRNLDGLSIESLSIEAVNVSNAGIQYVRSVRGIKSLRLWSPAFDDRGLKLVGELRGLEALDLEGTSVAGMGLEDLKELQNLEVLVLGPKTLDSAIAQLEQLPSLHQLDLRACAGLTLDCVDSLAKLANIEVIWLPRHIRTKGKRALREVLPECEVRS